jgi:hypothetical protein
VFFDSRIQPNQSYKTPKVMKALVIAALGTVVLVACASSAQTIQLKHCLDSVQPPGYRRSDLNVLPGVNNPLVALPSERQRRSYPLVASRKEDSHCMLMHVFMH